MKNITYAWYRLPDVLRKQYHQAIIRIYKELRLTKEYLGDGYPLTTAHAKA